MANTKQATSKQAAAQLSEETKRAQAEGQKVLEELGGPVDSQKKIPGVTDEQSSAVLADVEDGKPSKKGTEQTARAAYKQGSSKVAAKKEAPAKKTAAKKSASKKSVTNTTTKAEQFNGGNSEATTENTNDGVVDSSAYSNEQQTSNNEQSDNNGK